LPLSDVYPRIRESIVAFTPLYHRESHPGEEKPEFPPIIGTGFIVDQRGWIATNDHIIKALTRAYRPEGIETPEWCVLALMFYPTDRGILQLPLDVIGVAIIQDFVPQGVYYDREKPDIGFVQVNATGLPELDFDADPHIIEGQQLATAGFPMGTDALTAPGWLDQIGPTLQSGIVSSVLPFQCDQPHGFTLNVMTQGGASGSPVFCPDTGVVKGILYAGLYDVEVASTSPESDVEVSLPYRLPTNISYVVPSNFLSLAFEKLGGTYSLDPEPDAPTPEQMVAAGDVKLPDGTPVDLTTNDG